MGDVVGATRAAVAAFADRHALLPAGAAVVAAVSGGPDSVCLLDCLHALAEPRSLVLHVAHLDHGLRDDGSAAADAAYVRDLAAQYGLPVTCGQRDVRTIRREGRLSVQAAARLARYDFLDEVAARLAGAPPAETSSLGARGARPVLIATGHTATDQAETVLHHLIRGSGLAGLAGMQPRSGRRIHPLLAVERSAVEAYCAARGLAPRHDPSNASLAYTRNRLRHELLPVLRRYNPRADAALVRAATALADDLSYLRGEAARLLPGLLAGVADGTERRGDSSVLAIDQAAWRATPGALRAHLVRALIERLYGSTEGFGYDHLTRLRRILDAGRGAWEERGAWEGDERRGDELPVPRGAGAAGGGPTYQYAQFPRHLWVEQHAGVVRLSRGRPAPTSFSPQPLAVPGAVALSSGRLTATLLSAVPPRPPAGQQYSVARTTAYLDADAVGRRLLVRSRRPGDTLRPLGMGGHHKKLQDVLVDAGVSRDARDGVPIVVRVDPAVRGGEEIVWVAGHCLAEPCKLTAATSTVLCLHWEPATAWCS